MPNVDRNHPKRAASSESRMSLMEFMKDFPDDATCLEHLWRARYSPDGEHALCPKCDKVTRVRKGMTRKEGKIVKHMRCHTCGYEMETPFSN